MEKTKKEEKNPFFVNFFGTFFVEDKPWISEPPRCYSVMDVSYNHTVSKNNSARRLGWEPNRITTLVSSNWVVHNSIGTLVWILPLLNFLDQNFYASRFIHATLLKNLTLLFIEYWCTLEFVLKSDQCFQLSYCILWSQFKIFTLFEFPALLKRGLATLP